MQLQNIKLKISNSEKLSVEKIESLLSVGGQKPLRWAIVDKKDDLFVIDAVVTV